MPRAFDDRGPRFGWSNRSAGTGDENRANLAFESVGSLGRRCRGQIELARGLGDRTIIDRHQERL